MTVNTHPNSVWTDERVELLETLWEAGKLSCAGIAAELGGGITRNAVIGKALRLNLDKKSPGGAAHRAPKSKRPRAARTIHKVGNTTFVPRDDEDDQTTDAASVTELEVQTPPASFLGIKLINLTEDTCRYPRTVEGVTLFCGQPPIAGSPYCRECHKRCHSRGGYLLIGRRAA